MKAAIVYATTTGNTEKLAGAVFAGSVKAQLSPDEEALEAVKKLAGA